PQLTAFFLRAVGAADADVFEVHRPDELLCAVMDPLRHRGGDLPLAEDAELPPNLGRLCARRADNRQQRHRRSERTHKAPEQSHAVTYSVLARNARASLASGRL